MFGRLQEFIDDHGDLMPNEVVKDPNDTVQGEERTKIKLPASYNRKDVYDIVCILLREVGQKIPTVDCFYKLWRQRFWHVEITTGNSFSKCTKCVFYKQSIQKSVSVRVKEMWKRERTKHNDLQSAHRAAYTRWKDDSIMKPTEYLCIIVDGMDQSKTMVPHLARQHFSKAVIMHTMMKTNLTGILAHGRKPSVFVHSWYPYFPHDSNSVVSSIMKVLRDLEETGQGLPPRLRIQADNCARENKNKYILTLLALLVKFGYFEEVEMGFMIVGHTHTDVDALFSIFSKKLMNHDCLTLDELHELVEKNHHDHPSCKVIDEMADWHSLVEHQVVQGADRIIGYLMPHQFRFYMLGDNPVMQYKEFCTDETWKPDDGQGPIHWFPRDDNGAYAGPLEPFEPARVQPREMPDLVRGKEGIVKWLAYMESERHSWGGLTVEARTQRENAHAFWTRFLDESIAFCHTPANDDHGVASLALRHGFWPKNKQVPKPLEIELQVLIGSPANDSKYVGPARQRPPKPVHLPEFDPLEDVKKGHFVILRPDDDEQLQGVPFWLGEALTDVNPLSDADKPACFLYDYWIPVGSRKLTNAQRYENAWDKQWKRFGSSDWQPASSVIWSWCRNVRGNDPNKKVSSTIRIPDAVACKARETMAIYLEMTSENIQNSDGGRSAS
jgi:hypothetical protein